MPKRLTPESWIYDETFNELSAGAELFFRRLWTLADDYGNYYGSPAALASRVFPLLAGEHTAKDVAEYLVECTDRKLLQRYEVGSVPYVHITNYGQQIKSRPKFPLPPLAATEAQQLTPNPKKPTLHNVTVVLARSAVGLTPPQVQDCAARYLQTDIPEEWRADCLSFASLYAEQRNRPAIR